MIEMTKGVTKILVIDDDASVLHALGLFLAQEGYAVTTASKYRGKLKKVKPSELPDLIILDILLSEENGCVIAKGLKHNNLTANIPIVMISAHPNGKQMAGEAGADAYLPKPFEVDDLLETIDRLGGSQKPVPAGASA
ncbi:MAG: response regulator transcription factor [Candidatus Saccharimonadales bacterium]